MLPRSQPPSTLFFPHRAVLTAGLVLLGMVGGLANAQAQTSGGTPAAEAFADRAGTIKLVNGMATASSAGSAERRLAAGDPVFSMDHLTTGPESSVSMVLRDGTTIVLGQTSRVEMRGFAFDTTTYQGNLAVMVLRGSLRMISGLIRKNNADAVHVETPTAVIGIRGTDFIVDVDPAGDAR